MPNAPEYLSELARRAQGAVSVVEAAGAEARDTLVSRVEQARADAERMAESLASGVRAAEKEAQGGWSRIQADWRDHVLNVRARLEDRQAAQEAEDLALRAVNAERYAQVTADLAAAAVQEAEYAALYAALARADEGR